MTNLGNVLKIFLEKKVSEQHIDKIINSFYHAFHKEKIRKFLFDFSQVEWISNQELLVLTGLFKYLIQSQADLRITFLENGSSSNVDHRKAKQFIEIWEVWKIYKIAPDQNYDKYFDIDGNKIQKLRNDFKIYLKDQLIYERYGVTPFVTLDKISNYSDQRIGEMLSNVYKLDKATNEILRANKCYLPFENQTLNSIITKELYENFLDHFRDGIFNTDRNYAFMSLSLKRTIKEENKDKEKLQNILQNNFATENLHNFRAFYSSNQKNHLKNFSCIELSFLDFGQGISSTLKDVYNAFDKSDFDKEHFDKGLDTRVLEFAFRYNSSRHPLGKKYIDRTGIPRGLFDMLSIVKRFEGLLVARSNFGRVFFDFSNGKSFRDAIGYFGDETLYFPGTLISIYLPERNLEKQFDQSSIKPFDNISEYSLANKKEKYISLLDIQNRIKDKVSSKKDEYSLLFEMLISEFTDEDGDTLIYLDFEGFEVDERIAKKIIYFLISDYSINYKISLIVINPPPREFLDNIRREILDLTDVDKKYKLHPTPFVFLDYSKTKIEIYWIGVFSEADVEKLNDLLYETYDLRRSDFENPENVIGHINRYDKLGNLVSIFSVPKILDIYRSKIQLSRDNEVKKIVDSCIQKTPNSIYLCSGNYYQYEYLQLYDVLSNDSECSYLCNKLYQELIRELHELGDFKFISITSSSQKILRHFIGQNYINDNQAIFFENYNDIVNRNEESVKIALEDKVVLICDVISTGYMAKLVSDNLKEKGAELFRVGVLVDAIDLEFEHDKNNYSILKKQVVSICVLPVRKFRRKQISHLLAAGTLEVIRINPFTNSPISLSIGQSNYFESVLIENAEFLNLIDDNAICVGYYNYNNLIHPYFFNMDKILGDRERSTSLVNCLFEKIGYANYKDVDMIFYPKKSGIRKLDFDFFKDKILNNHDVSVYELERFQINEGWMFPHPPEIVASVSKGKKALILDDGSCSGESIIQMIDEVAFLDVREILVLSIIGRVNDHKREFFSRLNSISGNSTNVKIRVYFGCHWHIPTYFIEQSPVSKEREWLEVVRDFSSTPKNVKTIVEMVIPEIQLKSITSGNNRFLLRERKGGSLLKDLVIYKEFIGRISNYRFFKEHFDFFDQFVVSFEPTNKAPNNFQKIELICAVFLHEPYLYEKVKVILPDVIDKVEEFVELLFFGYSGSRRQVIYTRELYYDWQLKNLVHLFFIVFKDDRLFRILSTTNFIKLIELFGRRSSDFDYILYKLTSYVPIATNRTSEAKHAGSLMRLLDVIIEGKKVKDIAVKKLKRYRSFISTLPFEKKEFNEMLATVKLNYSKLVDDKYHKESLSVQRDIIETQLERIQVNYTASIEATIINTWEKIEKFLLDILGFSKSYPDFFIPFGSHVYSAIEMNDDSLRKRHARIADLIFYLNKGSKFKEIQELIKSVYVDFIQSESIYFKIFANTSVADLEAEYFRFVKMLRKHFNGEIKQSNIEVLKVKTIDIPLLLLREIIFEEVAVNMRNAKNELPVMLEWGDRDDFLELKITNTRKLQLNIEFGGGLGVSRFESLNYFPLGLVKYMKSEENDIFIQIFKFKKI